MNYILHQFHRQSTNQNSVKKSSLRHFFWLGLPVVHLFFILLWCIRIQVFHFFYQFIGSENTIFLHVQILFRRICPSEIRLICHVFPNSFLILLNPSTQSNLFPIVICFPLFLKKFHYMNWFNGHFSEPSPDRWKKIKFPSQFSANVFCSIFSPIRIVFEPVQRPCTMIVWNEPLHDMTCVVKRKTPTEWRWKLGKLQLTSK